MQPSFISTKFSKYTKVVFTCIYFFSFVAIISGCGDETEKAKPLVNQVNDIVAEIQPKLEEVKLLLTQIYLQIDTEQSKAVNNSKRANQMIDEIVPRLTEMKEKTDQIIQLNISPELLRCPQIKSEALELQIDKMKTLKELLDIYIVTPTSKETEVMAKTLVLESKLQDQNTKAEEKEFAYQSCKEMTPAWKALTNQ